jgi:hypothetical protein
LNACFAQRHGFLDYFLKRVMALDEMSRPGPRDGLIRRIFRWMAQPIGAP